MVIRQRILAARVIQGQRFKGTKLACNADMKNKHVKAMAGLSESANRILKQAISTFALSARTYFRLIKVARTIADLGQSSSIEDIHMAEALHYRVKSEL